MYRHSLVGSYSKGDAACLKQSMGLDPGCALQFSCHDVSETN